MTVRYTVRVRERVYARNVRLAAISAILLLLVGFLLIKQPAARPFELRSPNVVLLDIPVSQSPVLPKPPRPRVKPRLPVVSPDGRDDVDPGRTDGWDSLPKVDTAKALSTYKIGEVVEHMSEAVFLLEPAYPELARMAGIGGRVLVKLLVDVDGTVIDVGLLAGSGNSTLDRAALQAAARARFTPGRQGIQTVRVWIAIPYSFVIS